MSAKYKTRSMASDQVDYSKLPLSERVEHKACARGLLSHLHLPIHPPHPSSPTSIISHIHHLPHPAQPRSQPAGNACDCRFGKQGQALTRSWRSSCKAHLTRTLSRNGAHLLQKLWQIQMSQHSWRAWSLLWPGLITHPREAFQPKTLQRPLPPRVSLPPKPKPRSATRKHVIVCSSSTSCTTAGTARPASNLIFTLVMCLCFCLCLCVSVSYLPVCLGFSLPFCLLVSP